MKKTLIILLLAAMQFSAAAQVSIFPDRELGTIKPVNGVNNGPKVSAYEGNDNKREFADARIPYVRLHDSVFSDTYGGQFVGDISAIFPDFSRDENDPASYEFAFTDRYIARIMDTGSEVFFRLGQSIEHGPKKFFVNPPADFAKWARVCEHIIRHYNEGWADGFKLHIRYWEIWNEYDCNRGKLKDPYGADRNLPCWTGTVDEFYDFYETAAKHLKKKFPKLHIGGPAFAGYSFIEPFIKEMAARKVPLDFLSWHLYSTRPDAYSARAERIRSMLDANGYGKTESVCSEWNYVLNFTDANPASMEVIQSLKGASFDAAVLIAAQNSPLDIMHYYDARYGARYNGLFSMVPQMPLKGYYAFYAWSRLALLGTQIEASSEDATFQAAAAKGAYGRIAVIVNRFTPDNNDLLPRRCRIAIPEGYEPVAVHLTDEWRTYTEIPVHTKNGSAEVVLYPNAFAVIEMITK